MKLMDILKSDVEKYIDKLDRATKIEWDRLDYTGTLDLPVFSASFGPKFIKIIRTEYGGKGQKSVHCFIDYQGNLYKAAGWNAPAKGIRGTIYDAKPPHWL